MIKSYIILFFLPFLNKNIFSSEINIITSSNKNTFQVLAKKEKEEYFLKFKIPEEEGEACYQGEREDLQVEKTKKRGDKIHRRAHAHKYTKNYPKALMCRIKEM